MTLADAKEHGTRRTAAIPFSYCAMRHVAGGFPAASPPEHSAHLCRSLMSRRASDKCQSVRRAEAIGLRRGSCFVRVLFFKAQEREHTVHRDVAGYGLSIFIKLTQGTFLTGTEPKLGSCVLERSRESPWPIAPGNGTQAVRPVNITPQLAQVTMLGLTAGLTAAEMFMFCFPLCDLDVANRPAFLLGRYEGTSNGTVMAR